MNSLTLENVRKYVRSNFWLLVRYGISGLSGALANLVVFAALVERMGVWYLYAALIGFIVAYVVTFSMHKWWTFAVTEKHRTGFQSLLYLGSALTTLAVNALILFVLVEVYAVWPVLAQFVAVFTSALASFIFTSQITFHADEARWKRFCIFMHQEWCRIESKWWSWPLIVLSILILFAWARFAFIPTTFTSDAVGYVSTAEYIAGGGGTFEGSRYLKPLAPALLVGIAKITGISYSEALLVESYLMFLLLGITVFWFGKVFFGNVRNGVLLAVIVTTSFPMLRYGLDAYTESGAWALYFGALASAFLWYKTVDFKWLWFTAIFLLAGLMWKEYAVLAGVTFGFLILFKNSFSLKRKFFAIVQTAALVLVPWVVWQWHVYHVYGYSYIDWLAIGADAEAYQAMYTLTAIMKSLAVLLLVIWTFALVGLCRWKHFHDVQKKFLKALTLPSFGFVLWGYVSSRLFFSLVPLGSLFAVHGLVMLRSFKARFITVILLGVCNVGLVWLSINPEVRAIIDMVTYGK